MNKGLREILEKSVIDVNSKEAKDIEKRVKEIVADTKLAIADGKLNFADDAKLLYDVAELVVHIIVEDKKMPIDEVQPLAEELMDYIYFSPEGLDDPNISFLPDWLEEPVEKELFHHILPFVIFAIVKITK